MIDKNITSKNITSKLGIVICNFNKQNDVLLCIQSVLESKFEDYHIYVVDNASSDDSVSLINQGMENAISWNLS